MKNPVKKIKKVIITFLVLFSIIFVGVFAFSIIGVYVLQPHYDYVYYVDEREKDSISVSLDEISKAAIWFEYLEDFSSIGSAAVPKEIDGMVYTQILIMDIIPQIHIKDCRVEIRDIKNQIIPHKSVVIRDKTYYKNKYNEYIKYNNIDEYIKTKPVIDTEHTNYAIYYTYLHKNLKDVNEAMLNIKFKYEIDGKIYEQKINKKIYRRVKNIQLESGVGIPDKVEE